MKSGLYDYYLLNKEIISISLIIACLLLFVTLLFFIIGKIKPNLNLKELKTRTRSWWPIVGFIFLITYSHPIVSYISIALLSFFALKEFLSIWKTETLTIKYANALCYLAIPLQYYFAFNENMIGFILIIPSILILYTLVLFPIKNDIAKKNDIKKTTIQLLICVFSVSNLAYLSTLNDIENSKAGGKGLLLFIIFTTEINDILQFTCGKLFGKHKISPIISPNKTIEGLVGGILITTVIGYSIRFLTPFSAIESIIISLLIGTTGFMGDLFMSSIKRQLGLKDTGALIPGHGGILDRIDSLTISAPVFFYIVSIYY